MIDFDTTAAGVDRPALVSDDHLSICRSSSVPQISTSSQTYSEFVIGDSRYRLRSPLTLTFYPWVGDGTGELIAEPDNADLHELYPTGQGVTFEEAFEDWVSKLHTQVQTLFAKRPWEMTPEELRDMASVERMIDVSAYHRETPYQIRQIGIVTRSRPIPDRIQWADGVVEHVKLHQMPPEFATFLSGQRFEAICVRESGSCRLQKVVFVGRLGRLTRPAADSWKNVQTFAAAPTATWDEID